MWGFPGTSAGKESACNAGDPCLILGLRRSLGGGAGYPLQYSWVSLVAQMVKNSLAMRETWFNPWVGKIPWRRAWQPTPVFLPGESPWTEEPDRPQSVGSKESDTTERLSAYKHLTEDVYHTVSTSEFIFSGFNP